MTTVDMVIVFFPSSKVINKMHITQYHFIFLQDPNIACKDP